MKSAPVTCNGCGEENLFWAWNFDRREPVLVHEYNNQHVCPTPRHAKDIFPGWCVTCKAPDLLWLRKKEGFELTESYGLPHTCEQKDIITNMSDAKCKACNTTGLFWVVVLGKYTLTHPDGSKHTCPEYNVLHNDWAEAKRMDYAVEKAWINSYPDDSKCTKCKGDGHTTFLSKSKKNLQTYGSSEPILMQRPCMRCKRLGTFYVEKKKSYLKELRKKYWPYKGHHKWKKADQGL